MVAAGTLIAGKYRLERPIGKGGMGWVWRAQHVEWNAPVAVKLINPGVLRAGGGVAPDKPNPLLQRFFSEARAAAAIRSPHVVQILDHGIDPARELPFIVTELLEGETLAERLERVGRLDTSTTVTVLTHVARALTRMHESEMVHRDLKPSNVFLVQNDEELVAKVLDFGIAKTRNDEFTDTPITVTGQQLGTPYYMSPEQIRGNRQIDYRADLWAFGVMAFECLTGTRPFDGETIGDLTLRICVEPLPLPSQRVAVPSELDAWFLRCINRDRSLTFTSAREAAEALRAILTPNARPLSGGFELPASSLPAPAETLDTHFSMGTNAGPPTATPAWRRLGVVGLLLALGVGGFVAFKLFGARTPAPEVADGAAPNTDTAHAVTTSLARDDAFTGTPTSAPPDAQTSRDGEFDVSPQAEKPSPHVAGASSLRAPTTHAPKAKRRVLPPAPASQAPKPAHAPAPYDDLIEDRL